MGGWQQGQKYFHNNTKALVAFFTFILSQVRNRVFQKLHEVWYHNRLNVEAAMMTQVSSIKAGIEEIFQMKTMPLFLMLFFILVNIVVFFENIIYLNM